MATFKSLAIDLLRHVDNLWDRARLRMRNRKKQSPLLIATYRGFGRADCVHLRGRVLRYKPLYSQDTYYSSGWKNLIDNYRRFDSDEIGNAELNIHIGNHAFPVSTDEEGFFVLDQSLNPPLPAPNHGSWHLARIHLNRIPGRDVNLETHAEVLIPNAQCRFGVISDIDDTILQTHVTSALKLKMLYFTFFKNAAGRRPFSEVAAFYQALSRFPGEQAVNPFFYVSNSPWNLYDLLQEFMIINHLPKGPILLRDFGIPKRRGSYLHSIKYQTIEYILLTYPDLPFLLIGDSGEKDADIYLDIARKYPNRIRSIYIRDVRSRRRAQRIASLIRQATGVDIQLVHHYGDAARDAAGKGLLDFTEFQRWTTRLEHPSSGI